jgi:integrase
MVTLAVTTGLRRSELFALRWGDVNFSSLAIDVRRSICVGTIGDCKTETSRQAVPIEERVVADLWLWKEKTPYGAANDWIFPSNRNQGKAPCWPGVVMQKVIRPAALRAGIRKKIGWHTFRHTFSALLIPMART